MRNRDQGAGIRDQFRFRIAGAVVLMASAAVAFGQQARPWEQIATPPLHEFHPQQPKRIELKNGIVLFLEEDHELPFVSGSVFIPGGERDVEAGRAGLISLYGQTWRTSGTAKMDGDAMDDFLETRAASIETGGGVDSTTLSWESLKADADPVFSLAMDLLFHPKWSEEKLGLAKQQEATGIVRRNDDEGEIAGREAAKLVYGANSPYTREPELGTIAAVKIGDLTAWHDQSLKGKLIVGVIGDFDAAAMEAKLRGVFESLPAAKAQPARKDSFAGPKPGVYFIDKADVNQSNVQIVALGTDRRSHDEAVLSVLNDILGGGFSSRLMQTVRTKLGLAYAVGGGFSLPFDHPGMFRVDLMTKSPSTVDATKAALGEISGLNERSFTDEELKRSKDDILNAFLFQYDSRHKILAEQERLEFYGYPADYLETYKAAVEKVTLDDLKAAAKTYVHPEKLAVLVVGNSKEIDPGLDGINMGKPIAIDITIPRPAARAAEKKQ